MSALALRLDVADLRHMLQETNKTNILRLFGGARSMPKANDNDLTFVSKGTKERLDLLAAGVSLEKRTGYSISILRGKAVGDRLGLARFILKNAEHALTQAVPSYRTAVSRAYYSMYHAARALSFFSNGGDDYEEHSKLPGNIPKDFPSRASWENKLKRARLERNRADYD